MLKIPKQSISFTKSRQNPNPRMKDKLFSLTVRHRRARPWPYGPAQSHRRPLKGAAPPPPLFSGACSPPAKGAGTEAARRCRAPPAKGAKARWMATDAGRPGTVAAAAAESAGGDGAAMATRPACRRSSVRQQHSEEGRRTARDPEVAPFLLHARRRRCRIWLLRA
ncbi:unnamed protein product [Miscanthus lutarioriparius]|uniref:Uncharacterized protein n=1 Tax=Miscanthus lutarioriparius TaxID=422564 RepID=A0A811MYV7_9POAL|nr:unnamed protein product [Miscanthus lutarioriparius]